MTESQKRTIIDRPFPVIIEGRQADGRFFGTKLCEPMLWVDDEPYPDFDCSWVAARAIVENGLTVQV